MAKDKEKRKEREFDPDYDFRRELEKLSKRKKRGKIWIGISSLLLTTFVIISFIGYIVGQNRASAANVRLTNKAKEITLTQMGFRTVKQLTTMDLKDYYFEPDPGNPYGDTYIYWTANRISQKTFRFIVERSGYSADLSLAPITTRAFKAGEEIKLYESFSGQEFSKRQVVNDTLATSASYFGFNILFKIETLNIDDISGFPFYFDASSKVEGHNDIDKALRFGFTSNYTSDIIRPVNKPEKVEEANYKDAIAVGGRQDLRRQFNDTSHYYDYTNVLEDGKRYEIAFGDFETELTDEYWESEPASAGSEESPTTAPGVHALKMDKIAEVVKKAEFKNSFRYYAYENNKGNAIAYTDANGIAELNVKIWLEGWDNATTDDIDGINFKANLEFMVYDKE